jgi:hypothetical protein
MLTPRGRGSISATIYALCGGYSICLCEKRNGKISQDWYGR